MHNMTIRESLAQNARIEANPTTRTYPALTRAYDRFNEELFGGRLPPCLVTLQRKSKAYGYFAGGRFGTRDGVEVTDEIALNPSTFRDRSFEAIMSTLVHEMTHLEQHHFGKPSRAGYHNAEWAKMMRAVGLIPSHTGKPGGKEVGQNMTHYIDAGGAFERVCANMIGDPAYELRYVELWDAKKAATRKAKTESKTKYTCPACAANAWGKPGIHLICGDCHEPLIQQVMQA